MQSYVDRQIEKLMNHHLRHGSKASRRVEVNKIKRACRWIQLHFPAVKDLRQIGGEHLKSFLNDRKATLSAKTIYDYRRALTKLWIALERNPLPFLERQK